MSEILHITHEAGNLNEYSSTATDSGNLSAAAAAALVGSYGMSALINDNNAIYGDKTFTRITSTEYRYRFYIDPNSLTMANTNLFDVFWSQNSAGSSSLTVRLYYTTAAGYQLRGVIAYDGSSQNSSYYAITDAPHYVELYVKYAATASSNDGIFKMFIDGVQKYSITTLDLSTTTKPLAVRMGAVYGVDTGTRGTLFLDDLIFRDDGTEIGPDIPPATGVRTSILGPCIVPLFG